MGFAPYTPVYGCGNDGPGAKNLLYWLDRESPWRGSIYNLGVCACRGTGSGATSQHARCRACDAGIRTIGGRANTAVGNPAVNALRAHAGQLGLTEIIWNRIRYSAKAPNGARYTGVSPHYDHIHIALSLNATRSLNVPTIRAVMAGGVIVRPPAPPSPRPPVPLAPEPEDEEDMATIIRLTQPGNPHDGRVESITSMHRRWVPGNEYALYGFLGGKPISCNRDQFNAWTSNKEAVGTNPINGPI